MVTLDRRVEILEQAVAHLLRTNADRLTAESGEPRDDGEGGCPCPVPGVVIRLGCPEHGSPGG